MVAPHLRPSPPTAPRRGDGSPSPSPLASCRSSTGRWDPLTFALAPCRSSTGRGRGRWDPLTFPPCPLPLRYGEMGAPHLRPSPPAAPRRGDGSPSPSPSSPAASGKGKVGAGEKERWQPPHAMVAWARCVPDEKSEFLIRLRKVDRGNSMKPYSNRASWVTAPIVLFRIGAIVIK